MKLLCNECIHQKACVKTYSTFGRFSEPYNIVSCECFSDKEDVRKEISHIDDLAYYIASRDEYSEIVNSFERIEKVVGV